MGNEIKTDYQETQNKSYRRESTNSRVPNDDAEYKKKIKLLEDKIGELEKQNKNLNNQKEDVRSKSKQIEMLEKRNRDLEEAKRKLGRDILDQNRNNENEAKKIQDLKNEIHLLRSKGKELTCLDHPKNSGNSCNSVTIFQLDVNILDHLV